MRNKKILLIGGCSGIGLSIREKISKKTIVYYTSSNPKNKNYLNLKNKNSIKKGIKEAFKKSENFNYIIINSFVSIKRITFNKINFVKFEKNLITNIIGISFLMKQILKLQKKNFKTIFISSEAVKNFSWGLASYQMSKSALEILFETLKKENKKIDCKIVRLKKYKTKSYLKINGKEKYANADPAILAAKKIAKLII